MATGRVISAIYLARQPNHLPGAFGYRQSQAPSPGHAASDLRGLPGAWLLRNVADIKLVPVAAGEKVQAQSPPDYLGPRRERLPVRPRPHLSAAYIRHSRDYWLSTVGGWVRERNVCADPG